ncbi:MAG: hypothetical protein KJ771_00170 [Nanoarchaeota archaeon]|nr:hypothetical protein [Nanoarchaeota archaeon]
MGDSKIQLGATAMAVLAGVVVIIAISGFWYKIFGFVLIIGGLLFSKL